MRYYYERPPHDFLCKTGQIYTCDHPVYNRCTLFMVRDDGLAVIQQRYNPATKATTWGPIDPWLNDRLYFHEKFYPYFKQKAGKMKDKLYPTVTIRQIMWALRMKPLKREPWETVFDKCPI